MNIFLRTVLVLLIFRGGPKTAEKNGSSVPFLESICGQYTLNPTFHFYREQTTKHMIKWRSV